MRRGRDEGEKLLVEHQAKMRSLEIAEEQSKKQFGELDAALDELRTILSRFSFIENGSLPGCDMRDILSLESENEFLATRAMDCIDEQKEDLTAELKSNRQQQKAHTEHFIKTTRELEAQTGWRGQWYV
jgi:hypothetical protein